MSPTSPTRPATIAVFFNDKLINKLDEIPVLVCPRPPAVIIPMLH
jgi:hypothetical protein